MDIFDSLDKVKLIVYDCDGVLTDNRVLVDENGHEAVFFNRGDGTGISLIRKELGIHQIIISTETNPTVVKRGEKLGIEVINGVTDKGIALKHYCQKYRIPLENIMFIGNDINDLPAMEISGFKGCPNDAEPEVRLICDWISKRNGGYGVVRELYRVLSAKLHG